LKFKKMGKNLLRWILAIIFVWWLWRWVQGQGGILAAFNRAFPGMSTAPYWRYGIPTITGDVEDAIPPVIRRHTLPPITSDVEDAIPPTYQPTPTPVAPLPVVPLHPEMPPNIGLNDKLPWENNRRRGEVINALKADIARITRYSREVANTFTEVARVGGVDNYLSMQRERLTRARTLPSFVGPIGAVAPPAFVAPIEVRPTVAPPAFVAPIRDLGLGARPAVAQPAFVAPIGARPAVAQPAFVAPIGARPAVAQPAFVAPIGARPAVAQPVILPFTGQVIDHSPLTPVPVFEILPNRPRVFRAGGNISLMQGGLAFIQD